MYERMFGDALHADRSREGLRQKALVEAERARRTQRRSAAGKWGREAIAKALVAVATRLAPNIVSRARTPRATVTSL